MSVQDIESEYRELIIQFLTEISEVKSCIYHSDYLYRTFTYDNDQIYGITTKKIKQIYDEDRIDYNLFHATVKSVLEELGVSPNCPICEANIDKIMRE